MRRLALALILVAACHPAMAGPLEDGVDAYNNGDPDTAYKLWKPLAEQGNTDAQVDMGVLYANGEGVEQNYATAAEWYRKAADKGDLIAINNIGLMYMRGQGVQADDKQALAYYQRAADRNFAPAQFNLANMYADGRGGLRADRVEAYKWLTLAISNYTADEADDRDDAETMRDKLASRMTELEISDGKQRALTVKRSPAGK